MYINVDKILFELRKSLIVPDIKIDGKTRNFDDDYEWFVIRLVCKDESKRMFLGDSAIPGDIPNHLLFCKKIEDCPQEESILLDWVKQNINDVVLQTDGVKIFI